AGGPGAVAFVLTHGGPGVRALEACGVEALTLEARYGAGALRVVDELGPAAGRGFLERFGADAGAAYARLGPRTAALALREPAFPAMLNAATAAGKGEKFLALAERHGDRFLAFVRRNWPALAIGAVIADYSLHSDRYLETAGNLATRGVRDTAAAAGPVGVTVFGVAALVAGWSFFAWRLPRRRGAVAP
ncbi:MAG: hypothetical protein HZA54_06445, partial [Planctomycetes bacterium]|nr:hypothetical protein [Planctomycetota bacterium]